MYEGMGKASTEVPLYPGGGSCLNRWEERKEKGLVIVGKKKER